MKSYILLMIVVLMVAMLPAALIYDMPLSFYQPDGSKIDIFASGDEFHNWLHDADGYTIMRDEASLWYVYAEPGGTSIVPGKLAVGNIDPKSTTLQKGLNLSEVEIEAKYARYASMRDYSNGRSPHTGQFNNLVVFIRFADDPAFMSPISYYENMFNAPGINDNSQRNYFLHASYGQLTVDSFFYPPANGSTIVTYVDPQPRNYYRVYSQSNPIGYDPNDPDERGIREQTMLANSISYVAQMIPADLVIDGDNDGYVDNVCFIIQGSPDGWAELLWPHRWVMYYVQSYIRGARVWDFNLQLESSLFSSGASVLAHEMFHSLGAPDLYRYSNNTITPIGNWDLMAGNANPPQHMSAWMKYRYGEWISTVPIINQSGTYTLSPVASSAENNIYRILSWRTGESYVLEYRKGSGLYDNNLPGTGLLVYRLDTRQTGNAGGPPDELYIYRPFGVNPTTNGTLSMAHFNAQTGRTKINETTVPSGFSGSNLSGGLNLYDIGFAGDTITFSVKISDIQLTHPIGGETWFSGANKTITWKSKSTSGNVAIDYSLDGGNTWINLVAATPNDGDFVWNNIPIVTTMAGKVRVSLSTNGHSDSSAGNFIIVSEVNAPALTYPAQNAQNVETDPVLQWDPVFGATSYQIQIARDEEFDIIVQNVLNHVPNSFSVPNLQAFQTYYWRVATISDIGYSEFSPTYVFSTGEITVTPGIVSLNLPLNNASNQAMNPIISWVPATHAYTYHVQLCPSSSFVNDVQDFTELTGTSFQLPVLNPETQYYWRVRATNPAGTGYFSMIRRFVTGNWLSDDDNIHSPVVTELKQNYPNPFNPETTIAFSLKQPGMVKLEIYNIKGERVKTLHRDHIQAGEHKFLWRGTDDTGKAVSSGLYLYRLQSDGFEQTRRMLLLK